MLTAAHIILVNSVVGKQEEEDGLRIWAYAAIFIRPHSHNIAKHPSID